MVPGVEVIAVVIGKNVEKVVVIMVGETLEEPKSKKDK